MILSFSGTGISVISSGSRRDGIPTDDAASNAAIKRSPGVLVRQTL